MFGPDSEIGQIPNCMDHECVSLGLELRHSCQQLEGGGGRPPGPLNPPLVIGRPILFRPPPPSVNLCRGRLCQQNNCLCVCGHRELLISYFHIFFLFRGWGLYRCHVWSGRLVGACSATRVVATTGPSLIRHVSLIRGNGA